MNFFFLRVSLPPTSKALHFDDKNILNLFCLKQNMSKFAALWLTL